MNRKEVVLLKNIASRKIHIVLDALGLEYRDGYNYLYSSCPVHNGENPGAFSWHIDLEIWQCFSRGCHDKYGKDIFGLVRGILDCRFPEAFAFVKKICSVDGKLDLSEAAQIHNSKQYINRIKKKKQRVFPEDCLNRLSYHTYLEGRNFPRELIERYQIGVTSTKYKLMSNRMIFPVRNIDGQIVGFTGRTLCADYKERKINKWQHSKGFSSGDNLFNIGYAASHITSSGGAIIVEGPLDVLRLEQAGVHNGVGIFGRKLHNGQISLLLKAGANKLIIMLDADTAGQTGAEDSFNMAKSWFGVSKIALEKGDVGDLNEKEVLEYLR